MNAQHKSKKDKGDDEPVIACVDVFGVMVKLLVRSLNQRLQTCSISIC